MDCEKTNAGEFELSWSWPSHGPDIMGAVIEFSNDDINWTRVEEPRVIKETHFKFNGNQLSMKSAQTIGLMPVILLHLYEI